jgi:hypothetical protein
VPGGCRGGREGLLPGEAAGRWVVLLGELCGYGAMELWGAEHTRGTFRGTMPTELLVRGSESMPGGRGRAVGGAEARDGQRDRRDEAGGTGAQTSFKPLIPDNLHLWLPRWSDGWGDSEMAE